MFSQQSNLIRSSADTEIVRSAGLIRRRFEREELREAPTCCIICHLLKRKPLTRSHSERHTMVKKYKRPVKSKKATTLTGNAEREEGDDNGEKVSLRNPRFAQSDR